MLGGGQLNFNINLIKTLRDNMKKEGEIRSTKFKRIIWHDREDMEKIPVKCCIRLVNFIARKCVEAIKKKRGPTKQKFDVKYYNLLFLGIILLIARTKIEEKMFSLFMCSQKHSSFLYVRIFYIGFAVIRENIRTPFKTEWLFSNWTRFEFLRLIRNISSLNAM